MQTRLGEVIGRMTVAPQRPDDDVIDHDMILVWGTQRRIITGSDLLGRLLRGIATVEKPPGAGQAAASAPNQAVVAKSAIAAGSQQAPTR